MNQIEKALSDYLGEMCGMRLKPHALTGLAKAAIAAIPVQTEKVARADIEYLVKLADWAAGQGFCQLPNGLEEPEEWCFRMWDMLGPENGDGYSAEALADRFIAAMQPAPQWQGIESEAEANHAKQD